MFLKLRYWLIRKLVGEMPIIANCKVYDEDFDDNFAKRYLDNEPFMFYRNDVRKLSWVINDAIRRSQTSDPAVTRYHNNKYVLDPTKI